MTARAITTFGLALIVVHALACMPFHLDGLEWAVFLRLAPDEAIVLGLALIGVASGWRKTATHAAALALVTSAAFGSTAALWPMFRDRAFEWSDVRELVGLPHLMFGLSPEWWNAVLVLLPVALILHLVSYFSLARLTRGAGRRAQIAWVTSLQGLILLGVASGGLWHSSPLGALGRETMRTMGQWIEIDPAGITAPPGAERMAQAPSDLGGLEGADVHVLFLESYGRVALRHPEIGEHLRGLWPRLEAELDAAGFASMSGACRPAISGGASLLAHAQFFSGIAVPDHRTWERLRHCGVRPLPHLFVDAGYHTVEAMPAMNRHWPEGAKFFGFTEQVTQLELGYDGYVYHFGDMPDQFALHHLLERVIKPARKPVFSTFVSVTGHLPCTAIPRYITDWNITPETFRGAPAVRYDTSWLNARSSPDTVPAYRDAVAYGMQTAVGFACQLQRPSLVIVVGDHQPPIKNVLIPDDFSYDVPLHLFANRSELLTALEPLGLVKGLDVPAELVAFDSAEFGPVFLRAFSRP